MTAAAANNNFAPITNTYTTGTAATETIPSGAVQVIIEGWAGGGGGGKKTGTGCSLQQGADGANGAYWKITRTLNGTNWGQTLTYTVGLAGVGQGNAGSNDGGNTTLVNGTFGTAVNCSAGNGGGAINLSGGVGNPATGGDTNVAGTSNGGASAIVGDLSTSAGAFGHGTWVTTGDPGGAGEIRFRYT